MYVCLLGVRVRSGHRRALRLVEPLSESEGILESAEGYNECHAKQTVPHPSRPPTRARRGAREHFSSIVAFFGRGEKPPPTPPGSKYETGSISVRYSDTPQTQPTRAHQTHTPCAHPTQTSTPNLRYSLDPSRSTLTRRTCCHLSVLSSLITDHVRSFPCTHVLASVQESGGHSPAHITPHTHA